MILTITNKSQNNLLLYPIDEPGHYPIGLPANKRKDIDYPAGPTKWLLQREKEGAIEIRCVFAKDRESFEETKQLISEIDA